MSGSESFRGFHPMTSTNKIQCLVTLSAGSELALSEAPGPQGTKISVAGY